MNEPFVFGPELAIAKMPAYAKSSVDSPGVSTFILITCTSESQFWVYLILAEDTRQYSMSGFEG